MVRTIFRKDASVNAILYILSQIECKDMHKISKILYFADQRHLLLYGRTITGDEYIAMKNGPVPSSIFNIFKAVRGEGYFASHVKDLAEYFSVEDYFVTPKQKPNMDFLSETDVECLDAAIAKCRDLTFGELTILSHDFAWNNTELNRPIAIKDILREAGESEAFATREQERIHSEATFCHGFTK